MRRLSAIGIVLTVVALGVYLATPSRLVNSAVDPDLPPDLDSYIAERERGVREHYGVIPETEKRISWRQPGERTEYVVVYLHGFSSTRQAFAPTAELVAEALAANLFETRLAGHGLEREPLTAFRAEDWLDDAAEALAIGARLGEKIVLIGTSTGATLAVAMAGQPAFDAVAATVLVSPNFGPANEDAELLTGLAGPLVARLLVGDTHSWEPHNELQARFWTTSYPIDAAVEMMRLVDFAKSRLPLDLDSDLLVIMSPADRVVSPQAARQAIGNIRARRKEVIEMAGSGDPKNHILAGRILSPHTTAEVVAAIVGFVHGEQSRLPAATNR